MNTVRTRLLAVLVVPWVLLVAVSLALWIGPDAGVRSALAWAGLVLALLGGLMGLRWALYLARGLHGLQQSVDRLVQGRLDECLPVMRGDGFGPLQAALSEVGEKVFRAVVKVRVGTMAIATSSGFVAADNTALSQRTQSQASALEQTASSMEQLTATVQQNAGHARQAHGLVTSAAEAAQRGGQVVGNVVQTMAAIRDSSRRIGDITGVIDGIAFQTNILALNAAVEAARAGEHGRGFAVVAAEVRALAQRAATAAHEIKQLIGESVARVESGNQLAEQAGASMAGMVEHVQSVARIMGEIVNASEEQSAGLEEVNRAFAQIDEATQRNVALVAAATQTASSLQAQAVQLSDAVG